ncbi:MAG: hypothetical protein EXR77_02830 [Myxococcales bacterium]|nr:hypothetical protein [Myxococcales bacterium]
MSDQPEPQVDPADAQQVGLEPRPVRGRLALSIAVSAAIGTLLLRLRHLPELHRDGHWWLVSGDSWLHAERIRQAANGALPWYDPWTHAPNGNWIVWPPAFDALAALFTPLTGRDLDGAALAGMVLVAVCSALTAVLAVRVAMQLAPPTQAPFAGLVAGLAVMVHGGLHNYTQAGKVDHHALEPLVVFAIIHALLALARPPAQRRWHVIFSTAALVAAPVWLWPSSALTVGLVGGVAVLRVALVPEGERRLAARGLAEVFALAAAFALPLAWLSPFGANFAMVAHAPSWLQPLLLALAAVALSAASFATDQLRCFGYAAVPVALTLAVVGPLRRALLGGSDFVSGQSYVVLINESMPLWQVSWSKGLAVASWLGLATPALVFFGLRHTAGTSTERDRQVWAALLAVTFGLTLVQLRFATLTALPLAVLLGWAFAALAAHGPAWRKVAFGLTAVIVVVGVADLDGRSLPLAKRLPVWQALTWLKGHAEPPAAQDRRPWTVVASWALGHEIRVVGRMANVCSPLIAPNQTAGLNACLRAHLADDSESIEALLEHHNVRYWLTTPLARSALRAYAEALGQDPALYATENADGTTAWATAGACSNAVALHEGLGSTSPDGACKHRPNFRLVHVSGGQGAKVFERVTGAQVRGGGCQGQAQVAVEVRLKVGAHGHLWRAVAKPGPTGGWTVRVPWSSGFVRDTVAVTGMEVVCGELRRALIVPEQAVVNGLVVEVEIVVQQGR